jgi:hypothetical protein
LNPSGTKKNPVPPSHAGVPLPSASQGLAWWESNHKKLYIYIYGIYIFICIWYINKHILYTHIIFISYKQNNIYIYTRINK